MFVLPVSGRGHGEDTPEDFYDRSITLNVYRCYYENCIIPPDPATLPPGTTRPDYAVMWSAMASWQYDADANSYHSEWCSVYDCSSVWCLSCVCSANLLCQALCAMLYLSFLCTWRCFYATVIVTLN